MALTASIRSYVEGRKTDIERHSKTLNNYDCIRELYYIEAILGNIFSGDGGSVAGISSIGAPILGATKIFSIPQEGDTAAGTVDGVWHPAIGDRLMSATATDANGLHADALSVQLVVRLPQAILDLDSAESRELKNIAAFLRLDGNTPSFAIDAGVRGMPIGGLYAKAWIPRDMALATVGLARWESNGESAPFPNNRPIVECYQYAEAIAQPVFDESLLQVV